MSFNSPELKVTYDYSQGKFLHTNPFIMVAYFLIKYVKFHEHIIIVIKRKQLKKTI